VFDSPKTKSRRLLATHDEPKEIKLDFSWLKDWFGVRRSKLSALIISVLLTWFLSTLLHNYYPNQLRDWLIPGSYLPFLILLGLVQLYLYSYLFMSTPRASVISLGVCWLVWLKLHQFQIDVPTFLMTAVMVTTVFALIQTKATTQQ
jgi:hypothetical protein